MSPACFVIMPISSPPGYDSDHFPLVYRHLIKPACEDAGFTPLRADEVLKTDMIVVDIIRRLFEAPLVLCDLSGKNPNVMYELGFRQAFDRPVVLIKDDRTEAVFDIRGLRQTEYDSTLRVDRVKLGVEVISAAIKATAEAAEESSMLKLAGLREPPMSALGTKSFAVESLIREADFLRSQSGDTDRALIIYDKVLATDPNNQAALIGKARTHRMQQNWSDAFAILAQVIEADPSSERAYYNRACYKNVSNDVDGALDDLRKAIELFPNYRAYATRDPDFENIRSDPRFETLCTDNGAVEGDVADAND